jgi:TM2 domain-containing membrane protein YozV
MAAKIINRNKIVSVIILMLAFSYIEVLAENLFVTTVDLNLRSGAGKNYESIIVITKGDTVGLLEQGDYWAKIKYNDIVGYSAKQYLKEVEVIENVETESSNGFIAFILFLIVIIVAATILKKSGDNYRHKSTATLLSFFFGTIGLQKFYLGKKNSGIYSILFSWTFIPALVGLFDFVLFLVMKEARFNELYNFGKSLKQTHPKAAQITKTDSTLNTQSYILDLYQKGLYLDEILNSVRDAKLKMPNGDDILHTRQVTSIIRSILPNATFEIKSNNTSQKVVEKPLEQNKKPTNSVNYNLKIKDFSKKYFQNDLEVQDHNQGKKVDPQTFMANVEDLELKEFVIKENPDNYSHQKYDYEKQIEAKAFMANAEDLEAKEFAIKENPDNYSHQKYDYEKQVEAKAFMVNVEDLEVKEFAIKENPNNYSHQKYDYEKQVEAKAFMANAKDLEVKEIAIKENPNNYSHQKHDYEKQVEAKVFMANAEDLEAKEFAIKENPDNYSHQKYDYEKQIKLQKNKRAKIELDETIIDVNSESLDLSVEHNANVWAAHQQPPYWGHAYVYSYDEIKHANKAQKQFYTYFKNKVTNGEYVDIQGNTNYAFILYFDFLNEYQNHRDIKLLDEQFKLLGEICPKTRSYSLRSLQDELRKRTDSYSVDKLKDLEEPNYRFEQGYSDYNPDLYKLGNQYKDKLGLNKQEVRWLNKFYNPTNVFLSIEGCCTATIMQYVTLLKELEKQLKKKKTTLAKEVAYFKERLKKIYDNSNSDWEYYDTSYYGNRAESEVYLTMFKRVENSVRGSYGHKRKVSGDFPNADKSLSEEFEIKLGNSFDALIEELKGNVGQPNIETQIELNTQNVNRWRIELDELIVSFKQDDINSFIDGVIHLEETNQKNPNIENIFYQASKFISKYDKVQSLKYYAKYIYYDLKSKKFDNKELTKTVQKSLFKSEEQINDFKEIIADLIATSDIQVALEKISKIYIPKRRRIQLDRTEIEEVKQKHEGTVELLNEYLVDEKEKSEPNISDNIEEDIEITIIPSEENSSLLISEISLGQVQEELVKLIINNSFEIHQDEVDKYATANGMFKNHLIDSINEACEEQLDGEALIEEDDENYIIEESYYKEIAK